MLDRDASGQSDIHTTLGITFSFSDGADHAFDLDLEAFRSAIDTRARTVAELFLSRKGGRSSDGLLASLARALDQVEESLLASAGDDGLFVDVTL